MTLRLPVGAAGMPDRPNNSERLPGIGQQSSQVLRFTGRDGSRKRWSAINNRNKIVFYMNGVMLTALPATK